MKTIQEISYLVIKKHQGKNTWNKKVNIQGRRQKGLKDKTQKYTYVQTDKKIVNK